MLQTAMPSSERGGPTVPPALRAIGSDPAPGRPAAQDGQEGPQGGEARFATEAAALGPLVRAVVAYVLGEHKDHADVEDGTHETLRRALEGSARLRPGEPLRPWVLGIARHVAIDMRRRRRRERPGDAPPDDADRADEDACSWVERIADPGPAPDERAASAERGRRLSAALAGLASPQREAMLLFHVEGEAYQNIAARLGVPIGTVATWLSRGRRSLAEALGEKGRAPDARDE
jgi:RNA polymerase sigma-70 factor (ECF subfamily)